MRRLLYSFPLKLAVVAGAIVIAAIILGVRSVLGLKPRETPASFS